MGDYSKLKLALSIPTALDEMVLTAATTADLPNLRHWKNEHRGFFFYREEITAKQQEAWFHAYQTRPEDYMFIVIVSELPIGCMGIRYLENGWDVYNVILGETGYGKKGLMSEAFQAMLRFALQQRQCPITLKVLKNNPAVNWYCKQGFGITSTEQDYFLMSFQTGNAPEESQ
ncbi:MAG: GNAT family N-acetyltransferase [Anaerolineae bacterium]